MAGNAISPLKTQKKTRKQATVNDLKMAKNSVAGVSKNLRDGNTYVLLNRAENIRKARYINAFSENNSIKQQEKQSYTNKPSGTLKKTMKTVKK